MRQVFASFYFNQDFEKKQGERKSPDDKADVKRSPDFGPIILNNAYRAQIAG